MSSHTYVTPALGRSHSVSCDSPIFHPQTQETQGSGNKVSPRRKEIFDRVYGQIIFPPVIGLFIDTPQVQRLRDLKQVGNSHYVYPSTTHTRFEHCLGVSHLAMRFFKQIFENQAESLLPLRLPPVSEVDIRKDLWCVGIAGLCHDLGHGPLSHMFEKYVNAIRASKNMPEWSHEESSVLMLRTIWRNRQDGLDEFDLDERDLRFVELLIRGLKPEDPWPESDVGRPAWKRFMTDIVANKRSGLDVDKLDYIQRDSLSCFGSCALSSLERMFQGAYVLVDENDQSQICYQNKLDGTIVEVFINRARLFRLVYQHRVSQIMDQMTLDAFIAADEFFTITHGGKKYKLSEIVDHPEAYLQTGDWILSAILYSTEPELKRSRDILHSIQCRRIYKTLGYYNGTSSQMKAITARDLISSVESDDLKNRMQKWEDETGLCPIVMLELTIFKSSKDLGGVDPMSRIRFFNPRAEPVKTYFLSDLYITAHTLGVREEFRVVAASRMPLDANDSEALVRAFDNGAKGQDVVHSVARTETPIRSGKRPREDPYNEDSLIPDARFLTQHSRIQTPRHQRNGSPAPVIRTHLDK